MSTGALDFAFRHSPYKGAGFAVHVAIADSVNDQHGHELWISQVRLASKARVGRQKVNEILQRMCDDGLLELLEDNVGKPNRYRFLYPDLDVVYETRGGPRPVASGDTPRTSRRAAPPSTPVVPDDTPAPPRVSPQTTPLSPRTTPPVASDDTEPKRTQAEPKTSPSVPSPTIVEEEVLLEQLYRALPGGITAIDRLRRDPALPDLVEALVDLEAHGWPRPAIAGALLADPLDDARSLARVLTARARHLTATEPPAASDPAPRPGCTACHGTGWTAGVSDRTVAPCPCRRAA